MFTSFQIKNFFLNNRVKLIKNNLVDKIAQIKNKNDKPFYSLNKIITGQSHNDKIKNIIKVLKKNNLDNIFITAPENVAWVLNIRGHDNPSSPIPNSNLIITKSNKKFIIANKNKLKKLIKEKRIGVKEIIEPKNIEVFLNKLNGKNILIDNKSCSINYEQILNKKLKVIKKTDPIYLLKSIKNKVEIKNMIDAHIIDGVALTKFIYWIKEVNKKKHN